MNRTGLTARLALAMAAVAAVSALLAGLLVAPLLAGAREDAVRTPLARQADLLARLPRLALTSDRLDRVTAVSGLTIGVVTDARASGAATALTADELAELRAGQPVSTSGDLDGVPVLIEGRPSPSGGAVVLAADVSSADAALGAVRRRVVLALALGSLVALGLAAWLARRLGSPLTQAASAARRLAAGERGVELPTSGPPEVADVAAALGQLDGALRTSEERQRRFLLSVSHELRTPLTAVRGYAEGLADGTVPPEDARAVGATLVGEAERLEGYVADLLALARLQADDFAITLSDMDAGNLVTTTAEAWAARARTAGVSLVADAAAVVVRADPARLRQVLEGLLDNALRVTPRGGTIVLATRDGGVVEVRDSGPGLAPDDLAVAFEPGVLHERYRGRRATGGHGLGLAIGAGLVRRMGGTITAGSSPEGGAAFTITLPHADI
ncbi:two-component system sensor histidine kinase BaeS [Nocardioides sp. BE266]|uniref:sensor histidine kinase n=1 Tax=Nocardioides sp. BE266 TaxID=2817725 RepID=UPI00285D0F15|nr:HAMP domain-containing sensor histidine kinase [Nocardioides sp. BE266]MDR7254742.1 two-component system sensor histidine kinase BaeS [Nocardioides sp. BE266]